MTPPTEGDGFYHGWFTVFCVVAALWNCAFLGMVLAGVFR